MSYLKEKLSVLTAVLLILTSCTTRDAIPPPTPFIDMSLLPTLSVVTGDVDLACMAKGGTGCGIIPDAANAPTHCAALNITLDHWRPDPKCTPGATSNRVTQANIHQTICVSRYTARVRPPRATTDALKVKMLKAYGVPAGTVTELDHFDNLGIGGSNSVLNLSPQPSVRTGVSVHNPKDDVEVAMQKAVCRKVRPVPLAAAQAAMVANWETALKVVGA
jgi:hypothetical protein